MIRRGRELDCELNYTGLYSDWFQGFTTHRLARPHSQLRTGTSLANHDRAISRHRPSTSSQNGRIAAHRYRASEPSLRLSSCASAPSDSAFTSMSVPIVPSVYSRRTPTFTSTSDAFGTRQTMATLCNSIVSDGSRLELPRDEIR